MYFSGIRSRDRPARGSSSSMVSSSIAARHNGEVSQNGELNGTSRRDNDDDGFCIVRKRDDSVSRVLSHSYSARDIAGAYLLRIGSLIRFTARGGWPRSIMALENGPSIDSCIAGYLHVEDG